MIDLKPATTQLGALVRGVGDEQLGSETPCPGTSVGDLLDHVQTLSKAFAAAARKDAAGPGGPPPAPDAAHLGVDWRERIPHGLDELRTSWADPAAWTGTTTVGGIQMGGDAAGIVALDEVIIHGWDLARATGQGYEVDADLLEALMGFLHHMAEPAMVPARQGLFGPVVAVSPDSTLFDRVLGLTGRDPGWSPGS
jgi:uncharacterized protein (TIGR03086 family)